ncbi:MAG TPA: aminotransferase class I/II-fold pyridoxal phosphate-dependent enzyme, partial [Polyangiaceae bacterium]
MTPDFPAPEVGDAGLSALARGVVGSEILKIAAEIRARKAKGEAICNLTVGDFDPAQFPIPAELLEGTRVALAEGHTNYPPSDGVLVLREALVRYYERELGLKYPIESVLVAGGARPLLYGAYRTLL